MTDKIFLAAGGTGGHVFPAEALARALIKRGLEVHLVTDSRGKAFGDALPEVTVHRVSAATSTGGLVTKVKAALSIVKGTIQAYNLFKVQRPIAVVAFGGYPSMPGALAAILHKIPLVLHDQNAVLGRANRLVAKHASVIAKSFKDVCGLPDHVHAVLTGNPIRPNIIPLRDVPYVPPIADGPVHLLVTGGSLGARIFGEVVPPALARLSPALKSRLRLSQQVRAEDLDKVRQQYAAMGLADQVELQPFFTDMPTRLANCHLFVGRAGGSTVAEINAVGRPAIYVPLPIAILDEQTFNAKEAGDLGGAWSIPQPEFTPEKLASLLETILNDAEKLEKAATAAHSCGRTDAAERLADLVLSHKG